ncbi:MAG: gamma carbonic anhydrase family protein [Gammaproteobacteria bacterium]|nr:gamma carbonic anhydrase family protein [Gammaproteobacteria bacterium]
MIYSLGSRAPVIAGDAWIAPGAILIGSVTVQSGASVWFGCVLRGDNDDLIVGEGSNVQDGCVLHTDPDLKLVIGARVTVGHQVMLHGCTIGDDCLIGIGARVLNRAEIGAGSIVAAGSLVPEGKRFPPRVMLMGSPARVVRELDAKDAETIAYAARHYLENAQRYRRQLQSLAVRP